MMKRRSARHDFALEDGRQKRDDRRNRKVSRKTPSVLAVALEIEDHKRRWELLRAYRKTHEKPCSLKSWTWIETALLSFEEWLQFWLHCTIRGASRPAR